MYVLKLFISLCNSFFLLKIEVMDILERELEDMLFECIEYSRFKELEERGLLLDPDMNYGRQINLIDAGVADIVGVKKKENENDVIISVSVIELKRHAVNISTLAQANRYLYYIEEMVKDYFAPPIDECKALIIESNIILIGNSISKDVKELSFTSNGFITSYQYEFSLIKGCEFYPFDEFFVYEGGFEALDNIDLFQEIC